MKCLAESAEIKKAKVQLGKKIKQLRESKKPVISQRKLAPLVGLSSSSNLKYIEDGVNAPTAEVYDAIIQVLAPKSKQRAEMDRLYTIIRGIPPPDVCNIICRNQDMNDALRILEDHELTDQQIASLKALLTSFKTETTEGENNNG